MLPTLRAGGRGVAGWILAHLRDVDLWLIVLAVVYAWPTLLYPFGRDQAAFAYVGWGWLDGFLPYRDSVDQKPPAVYLVHAILGFLLGRNQAGIRLADILLVMIIGWLASRAVPRVTPRRAGELGALVLVTAGFYFTCFDYWDTAQTELWQGAALLAGIVALQKIHGSRRAALVSGALGASAVLFKFTAGVVCLGLAGLLVARAWKGDGPLQSRLRRAGTALGYQILAAAAVIGATLAYFAARGGLRETLEVLLQFNLAYWRTWTTPTGAALSRMTYFWGHNSGVWITIILLAWILALLAARRRRLRPVQVGGVTLLGFFVLAILAVVSQAKYFPYHWGILTPFLGLAAGQALAGCGRWRARLIPWLAVGGTGIGLALSPGWISGLVAREPHPASYSTFSASAWRYAVGSLSREEFLRPFVGEYGYRYRDQEILGREIRRRARPGDGLLVRGFEPALYTVSGLRCPSRFFIEITLREPRITYDRDAWLKEHEEATWSHPPRFVVTHVWKEMDLRVIEGHGYHRSERSGSLVLLERNRDAL